MVYRVYVEKKKELAHEASALYNEAVNLLGISTLKEVRVINRYDAEKIDADLFEYAKSTVFSEPQLDRVYSELDTGDAVVFAVHAVCALHAVRYAGDYLF